MASDKSQLRLAVPRKKKKRGKALLVHKLKTPEMTSGMAEPRAQTMLPGIRLSLSIFSSFFFCAGVTCNRLCVVTKMIGLRFVFTSFIIPAGIVDPFQSLKVLRFICPVWIACLSLNRTVTRGSPT